MGELTAAGTDVITTRGRHRAWVTWGLLAGVLILATVVRTHRLTRPAMWLDEQYSLELSTGRGYAHTHHPTGELWHQPPDWTTLRGAPPAWHVWPMQAHDAHPPLYFVLLRVWREAWSAGGDLPAAATATLLRSLSVIWAVASIALIFALGRQLGGTTAGTWAALIMTFAGPHVSAAQEGRSYTMATALVIGSACAAVAIVQHGWTRRRGVLLGICALAAMLTHYAAAPPLAAIMAYVTARTRGRDRWRSWAAIAIAAAVFLATWGPWLPEQARFIRHFHARAFVPPDQAGPAAVARHAATVPFKWLTEPTGPPQLVAAGAFAFVIPFVLLRRRPEFLLPALWMASSPAAVGLWDLLTGSSQLSSPRYTVMASPALYLALGLLASWRPSRLRWAPTIPAAAVMLLCVASLPWAYERPVYYYGPHEDWRRFADRIGARCDPGRDAILYVCTGDMDWEAPAASVHLCMHPYGRLPSAGAILNAPPSPTLLNQLAKFETVWVVTAWHYPPLDEILPGYEVIDREFFPEIRGGASRMRRVHPATSPSQ